MRRHSSGLVAFANSRRISRRSSSVTDDAGLVGVGYRGGTGFRVGEVAPDAVLRCVRMVGEIAVSMVGFLDSFASSRMDDVPFVRDDLDGV